MDIRSIRLPKLLDSDPRAKDLLRGLVESVQPLRRGSYVYVPVARFAGMKNTIKSVHRAGRVVRGLESVKRTLATEKRGMGLVDRSSGVKRGERISRLLLLSNDGSDGFYRQIENLLVRHTPRVLAIRLNVDAPGLGEPLFGPGRLARLLMIQHKDAVAEVLVSLAGQFDIK